MRQTALFHTSQVFTKLILSSPTYIRLINSRSNYSSLLKSCLMLWFVSTQKRVSKICSWPPVNGHSWGDHLQGEHAPLWPGRLLSACCSAGKPRHAWGKEETGTYQMADAIGAGAYHVVELSCHFYIFLSLSCSLRLPRWCPFRGWAGKCHVSDSVLVALAEGLKEMKRVFRRYFQEFLTFVKWQRNEVAKF